MKKGNVVDLDAYRKRGQDDNNNAKLGISKELQLAIKRLILRMRKPKPMRKTRGA
jgi:hypothetical protein